TVQEEVKIMEQNKTQAITAVTIKKPDKTKVQITLDDVRRYLCPGASPQEIVLFLKTCQSEGLDPWAKEIYLIKYDAKSPASMVISADAYLKTAETNDNYNGHEAGIILKDTAGKLEFREGSFILPEEENKLVGGWAKVYRKDRAKSFYAAVPISEYRKYTRDGKPSRFWNEMPASMIRKVALSHALKEAFPNRYSGIYTTAEFELVPEGELPPAYKKNGEDDWSKFWAKQAERGIDGVKAHALLRVGSIKADLVDKGKTLEEVDEMITEILAEEKGEEKPAFPNEPAKPERDPETIKNFGDLYTACHQDFKMTRQEVWAKLNVNSQEEITDVPAECYRRIAAVRR
ncbi:MAG: phage recombination protein Bet, partial [Chloroflexota bacterium]|nr:phage recombination protein Bet [Chloroflexota bacterium]